MRFAALNPALKRRLKFRGRSASKDESGGSAEANRMESVIGFLRSTKNTEEAQRLALKNSERNQIIGGERRGGEGR